MKIAEWFAENEEGLQAVKAWSAAKKRGQEPHGIRGLLAVLKAVHEYPFRDHTALWNFMKKELGEGATVEAPAVHTHSRTDAEVRKIEKGREFIVTSAVNNCHANEDFLRALEHWREDHDAKIIVNPIRYQNPTRDRDIDEDEWWDPALAPYMLDAEIRPHERLSIMPTKVQATTNNPLPPRLDGRTKNRSAIFGHPQLMMRTVPILDGPAKMLWSSGAVTEKEGNYSQTMTGDMAEFHHGFSAVIAQVRGDQVHMREVTWDGAAFIDCDRAYTAQGSAWAPNPIALVMGDIHVGLVADEVMRATFGEGGIYPEMQHAEILLHDLANFHTVSPHDAHKRLTRAALAAEGRNHLGRELDEIVAWLDLLPSEAKLVVARSNHDEFLRRWLEGGENAVEPQNRKLYHYLSFHMLEEKERTGRWPVPLELALRDQLSREVTFLDFDDPYIREGVSLGNHGHLGKNGAKGSIRSYAGLGTRSVIGHSHSPGIFQGVYQTGHSAVADHGYNQGPSGWLNLHVSLHANGRRQSHNILPDGSWRGE